MGCRCADMALLIEIINKLIEIKGQSPVFKANIDSCKSEQELLKKDSWSATESTTLKNDIENKLPNMEIEIEEAHDKLIEEINKAIKEIEEEYRRLKAEDDAYH